MRSRSRSQPRAQTAQGLSSSIQEGIRRSRSTGRAHVVSVTERDERALDPTAAVLGSRRSGESWFCMEQPERQGWALGALGSLLEISADDAGAPPARGRFAEASRRWRELTGDALAAPASGPPGSGLALVGGFAFAAAGASTPKWNGYRPASLVLPEVTIVRQAGASWVTLNALVGPDDLLDELTDRLSARLQELRSPPMHLVDPAPTGSFRVSSPMSPSHYEEAVARAVERIRSGELQKVVLAREVEVHAPAPHDPAAILAVLREAFPACFTYAVGRGSRTFLGASPELLVRREGQRATTVALAGSARRSADPAVDDHLSERLMHSDKDREENQIVTRRIIDALEPRSVWVTAAADPTVVRVANIQHLAVPIRAQLTEPVSVLELAGLLHPTPAVGGEPLAVAEPLIPALEGFDRGWYAGPIGWCDLAEDGEFCVALRCALLDGATATCFAGAGIVSDSDPASELAETEVKLQALLPVLTA